MFLNVWSVLIFRVIMIRVENASIVESINSMINNGNYACANVDLHWIKIKTVFSTQFSLITVQQIRTMHHHNLKKTQKLKTMQSQIKLNKQMKTTIVKSSKTYHQQMQLNKKIPRIVNQLLHPILSRMTQ